VGIWNGEWFAVVREERFSDRLRKLYFFAKWSRGILPRECNRADMTLFSLVERIVHSGSSNFSSSWLVAKGFGR
jgi:hypothetical protein